MQFNMHKKGIVKMFPKNKTNNSPPPPQMLVGQLQ